MTGQTEEQFFCLPVSAFFWWHIQLHMSGGAFARYDNSDREEIVNFFFAMLAYFGGSYGREVSPCVGSSNSSSNGDTIQFKGS